MHITTKALVLRDVDYKESDKILTLLTQELGKVTASARGCRKKGSPIAAGCQLLCWSEMVLYEYQGRWVVKEANTEREFRGVREDLEKLFGTKVYLNLWVKVKENWRESARTVGNFGYREEN